MSKFLYPIYKLNIESYKKWWLYYKKAGGSGILSEILEGFSFNLANTLNRKFKLFEIEGNSTQDGTPSPETQVPILSAGDNGSINEKISNKNVWNIDKFKNLYGTNSYETYNNVECLKLAGATQRYNFDGKENTQYTFQFKLIGSTINSEIGAFSLVYSDGTSDYHDGILTPKTYTFTSKANKTLVRIVWNAWNAGNFIYIDKNSMQLEPGTTATPYVPHEEQDYSIFVQQPFRSIGDVRDCFVKKDGSWYERHMPYIASYNGETLPQDVYNEVDNVKYCNEKSMSTTGQFSIGASVQYIDENNWNYLPCTQAQIEVLENLPSTYKDFTIIQSQDETPAHLKIQYYKEG